MRCERILSTQLGEPPSPAEDAEASTLNKRRRAMLAWQRERWHLRQKKKDDQPTEPSLNKQFRMTPIDPKILNYINRLQLGRRRDQPAPLNDAKWKKQLTETMTELDKVWVEEKVKFVAGATTKESFITPTLPEVAFIGRSNVGKSSLINALTMQGKVRVSDSPGETQQINWYHVGKHIALIDLPGYGFAFASEEKIKNWTTLMQDFLTTRNSLKRICLLIDARHGIKPQDWEFIKMLEKARRKYQVILTKADLVTPQDLARRYHLAKEGLKVKRCALERIMMVSSWNGAGLSVLRRELVSLMEGVRPAVTAADTPRRHADMPDYEALQVEKSHSAKDNSERSNNRPAHRTSAKAPRTDGRQRSFRTEKGSTVIRRGQHERKKV